MPYFIYRITEPRNLAHLDTKDRFQEAKVLVRALRGEIDPSESHRIRMVFANSTEEAEKLLSIPKDNRVIGED